MSYCPSQKFVSECWSIYGQFQCSPLVVVTKSFPTILCIMCSSFDAEHRADGAVDTVSSRSGGKGGDLSAR